jgi:RNA polymerase sigma factor (TIGR02999 family)
MSDVTRILSAIEQGDPHAAAELLPLVYDELRKLAARKLAQEKPGQTLDATALVHEAYLRLIADEPDAQARENWANRRHFFAAAAKAMRRILIESARRKQLVPRVDMQGLQLAASGGDQRLLELHDALDRLAVEEPVAAQLVEARVFAGLSVEEAAGTLGLSRATAYREWAFARAWLATALSENSKQI